MTLVGYAQQDASFTHYKFNQLYYNAGYAGISGATTFKLLHRSQWLGYSADFDKGGSQSSQMFSADVPLLAFNGGVGFTVITDKIGPMRNTSTQLSLSKHAKIGKGKLGLGLQASGNFVQFGLYDYRPPQEGTLDTDPSIPKDRDLTSAFDLAGGAWYESKEFFVGLGVNKLMNNNFNYTSLEDEGGFVKHFYLMGGYNFEVSYDLVLTPTLLIKSSNFSERGTQFDLGAIATYKNDMWGGLNFRQGESIGVLLGKNLSKDQKLKLGYSLDMTIKGLAGKKFTSHEIMLTYALPNALTNLKPIIRTPRFRY